MACQNTANGKTEINVKIHIHKSNIQNITHSINNYILNNLQDDMIYLLCVKTHASVGEMLVGMYTKMKPKSQFLMS